MFGSFPIFVVDVFVLYNTSLDKPLKSMFYRIGIVLLKRWENFWVQQQFIYECMKKALCSFAQYLLQLSSLDKEPIWAALEEQFRLLFKKLSFFNTRDLIDSYV